MKRWLITILIFLVAGAVVNVAVAWGCAVWGDLRPRTERLDLQGRRWNGWCIDGPGGRRLVWHGTWIIASAGDRPRWRPDLVPTPAWSRIHRTDPVVNLEKREFRVVVEDARGWPRLALASATVYVERFGRLLDGQVSAGLIASELTEPITWWPKFPLKLRVLPLRPVWPGFAVNTLVYTSFLWLLSRGPLVLRRFLRVKRSLCPACTYPIGVSSVCTECGKPLPKRPVA